MIVKPPLFALTRRNVEQHSTKYVVHNKAVEKMWGSLILKLRLIFLGKEAAEEEKLCELLKTFIVIADSCYFEF